MNNINNNDHDLSIKIDETHSPHTANIESNAKTLMTPVVAPAITPNIAVNRKRIGTISSLITWFFNILLAISKIIIGSIFNTIALLADGVNNLFDSISSGVSYVGFIISNKPADKKHPFGHARVEYIATLIISFIVIFVGAQLAFSSIKLIINKEVTEYNYLSFIILAISMVIKFGLFIFNRINAKKINSSTLKGIAIDCLNDILASSIVLVGFLISYFTKISLDGYLGIIVSLFILFQGIILAKEIITPLLGEKPDKDLIKQIVRKVKSYEGVLGIHDLVCHCYGSTKIFISLHVEVDANSDIMVSHELIDKIENDITTDSLHLVIHMDPIVNDDEVVNHYKNFVAERIKNIDSSLTFHDFRMVIGKNKKNIIFDIVVPFDCKISESTIHKILTEELADYDKTLALVMSVDKDYIQC